MGAHLTVRAARYAVYAALALVLVLVAIVLVAPLFLDTPAVERALKAKLSQMVQGEVAWKALSIRLLPSPRGALSEFRAEIPGVASVRAESVEARLRLLPLLRGHAEVASVSLSKPVVRLDIAPATSKEEASQMTEPGTDPVASYRAVVGAIRSFAPDTEVEVEGGELDISLPGMPPVRVRAIELHGSTDDKGLALELTASSDAWSRLKMTASVGFADFSGEAKAEIGEVRAQPWLDRVLANSPVRIAVPSASLRVQARSDAKNRLEADFDLRAATVDLLRSAERVQIPGVAIGGRVSAGSDEIALRLTSAQLGASRLGEGSLRYGLKDESLASVADFDLDLAHALDATRRLLPGDAAKALERFRSPTGRAQGQARFDMRPRGWNCSVEIRKSDMSIGMDGLPGPLRVAGASLAIDGESVKIDRAAVSLLDSRATGSATVVYAGSYGGAAEFDLDGAQALDAVRGLAPDARKSLADLESVSGRARGRASVEVTPKRWSAQIDLQETDVAVGMRGLPGPIGVAGGSVSASPGAVKVEGAKLSLLDARAVAAATIGYGSRLAVEGSVSDGSVGANALAWGWKEAEAPRHVVLKTPIRFAVQRAAWRSQGALDLAATASFDAGPSVAVDLGWKPGTLDLRRAAIKDAKSDARLALHLEKGLAEGRFSGSLQGSSIGAALVEAKGISGRASGDLRFRVDLAQPERATASGRLQGDSLDFSWLVGQALAVERVDLQADGQTLVIRRASVNWAEQRFALAGTLARAPDGAPVIDAQLTSPGVVVDALLPAKAAKEPEPAKKGNEDDEALWKQWPLPVRGRVALRAGFVQYGERRAEPVVATLTLEERRASLELQQVRLCGISFPMTAEARPEGVLSFSVQITAQKQQLEQSARCLTERGVQMTGEFDLSAQIRSSGKRSELVGNLDGKVELETRNGRVRQFPLIFKILSLRDVADSLKKDGVSLDDAGFPYLSIAAKGRFDRGRFVVDESAFRSNSVGFAARGSISLSDKGSKPYDSELTVLVAPLSRLDSLVRALPLVGYIVGGTLTSWPVRVTEDIRDPKVEAVSPSAITSEFVGMFQRTLKLPEKLLPKLGSPTAP